MNTEDLKETIRCGETTTVQFKQEFTSQKEIAKEMIAFANTRGGRIFFGIKDKTGEIIGLSYEEIQTISQELGNTANEQVRPTIYIETDVLKIDGKHVLVCTVEQGKNKPYKNLTGEIWVKQGADKRRITENSEILALFQDSGTYRPELQPLHGSSIKDLEMAYVNEYFTKTFGKEKEDFGMPLEQLLKSQNILAGNGELTQAGVMFFGRNPQHFLPAFVVKAVAYVGNDIAGSEYRDSRDISGTVPCMFREAMSFAKSNLHYRQNGQNFNKTGIPEIPEVVLEELIQNSLVHLDLLHPAAIRLLIFDNRIEIVNSGSLFGGINVSDLMLGVSKQRNPAMAELSGRTMIYRGLGSGILRALKENVKIDFDNEESANQFRVTVWKDKSVNQENVTANDTSNPQNDSENPNNGPVNNDIGLVNSQNGLVKDKIGLVNSKNGPVKDEIGPVNSKNGPVLTERQKAILDIISENNNVTLYSMANVLSLGTTTIKRELQTLKNFGLLKRAGSDKTGHWEIIAKTN
ncbi:MAG: putative DNA binding domain-containing protein [Bacteroidales bacterium]|nr:putative DNA binding domain-containing protein [Bacteroidales bacterium]